MLKACGQILEDGRTERKAVIGLVGLSTLVQSFVIFIMPISLSTDSWGYLTLALDFFSDHAFQRTIGYPFMIAFAGIHYLDSLILLIYMQSLLVISIPVLVYFTVRPFSKNIAFLAALVNMAILYPYIMAVEVMTETPFMFAIALFGFFLCRYFHTVRLRFLVAAVGTTLLIALLRVSGTVQFLCLLTALGVFFLYHWRQAGMRRTLIRHGAVAVAIFVAWQVGYGAVTDRTSKTILPFFTFNWLYRAPILPIYYGAIHPKNGPKTEKLFAVLGELVEKHPNIFRKFAANSKENVKAIVRSKKTYDAEDAKILVDDLINNNAYHLRGFKIPWTLKYQLGTKPAAELLYGAMIEAVMANPDIIVRRAKTVVQDVPRSLSGAWPSAFHTVSFWVQRPKPGQGNFHRLGPGVVAEWLYGLNLLVGSDDEAKKMRAEKGRFPTSFKAARRALEKDRNYTAFGSYLAIKTGRIIPYIWAVMIAGLGLFCFSTNPAAALGLALAAFVPAFTSVLISELDTRHFAMPFPIQLMAAAVAVAGLVNLVRGLVARLMPRMKKTYP